MKLRHLNDSEKQAYKDGLSLAERLAGTPPPFSPEQVQAIYDAILDMDQSFAEHKTALGLAFGELIAKDTPFEWVRVSDEYGEETALCPPGFAIVCSPISMILKRINARETVDIAKLASDTRGLFLKQYEAAKANA